MRVNRVKCDPKVKLEKLRSSQWTWYWGSIRDTEPFLEVLETEIRLQWAEQWGGRRKWGQQCVNSFSRILATKRTRMLLLAERTSGVEETWTWVLHTLPAPTPTYSRSRSPGSSRLIFSLHGFHLLAFCSVFFFFFFFSRIFLMYWAFWSSTVILEYYHEN